MVEQTLEERVFGATEELLKNYCETSEKFILLNIEKMFQAKSNEVNKTLQKAFGLESDPIAHVSDLIALGRKKALSQAETSKRTPAAETPAGPEGNVPPNLIDQMFEKAKKGEWEIDR